MMSRLECWAFDGSTEQIVADMRTLRWTSGVTRGDKLGNDYVRGGIGVFSILVENAKE